MPDEEFSPIDAIREQAAVAAATPPNAPEYGLDTRTLPVSSKDDAAPLGVALRGPTLRPATPGAVLMDIVTLEETMSVEEWRRFRTRIGRLLGFVMPRGDPDDTD